MAIRLPFVVRVGPGEGGGDEWYAVWRSWCVLFERGNPGNFLHPALFYEAGAALFGGLYVAGTLSGAVRSTADLLTDFVLHEAKYLQALQSLAAVFGALTVPVVFELGRRLSGWRAGLVAAIVLGVLPLHVEYSQRVRVDSLCVLLTALAALALHRLAEGGRRRDFVRSGVLIGLATAANYPAAFLVVAYLGAARCARGRAPRCGAWCLAGLGAAAAAFVVTNPYVILTPAAAWRGFGFQLSLAVRQHPYNEDVSRWFYLRLLREQSIVFATLAVGSAVWLVGRARGFRRMLGLLPWLFIGTFVAASNRVDRYVLIATPWLCAAVAVFLVEAPSTVRSAPRRATLVAGGLVLFGVMTFELWRRTEPLVFVTGAGENPRAVMQRWLIEHAPPGGTVWLEADVLPLLQATFADPGGDLQANLQRAFARAYPAFHARLLKGERIERNANFDPALVTERRIDLALTCDSFVRYVDGPRPELASQRAFYTALAAHGTRRFEAMDCWIAEIR